MFANFSHSAANLIHLTHIRRACGSQTQPTSSGHNAVNVGRCAGPSIPDALPVPSSGGQSLSVAAAFVSLLFLETTLTGLSFQGEAAPVFGWCFICGSMYTDQYQMSIKQHDNEV